MTSESSPKQMDRMAKREDMLTTSHGELRLPCFLPDATRGVARSVDAEDLRTVGISGVMVNALHLSHRPGTSALRRLGGIHSFMGWSGLVASDSGGFQVYSLIAQNAKLGAISDNGFIYRLDRGGKKRILTPEKCIQHQFRIGSDMMFCLDVCTHPDDDESHQRLSCDRTIAWAKRCKLEFKTRLSQLPSDQPRPLLFAVVQGGSSLELRRQCAEALVDLGFDGYGFGGWPIGPDGQLVEAVAQVTSMTPASSPRFALGIGKPENLAAAYRLGYDLFDCSIPTRDARRMRLFAFQDAPERQSFDDASFYKHLYIQDDKHALDTKPVDETCDCPCCSLYSRAYLHHLFKLDDPLAYRLATLHNLRFYVRLTEALSKQGRGQ